MLSEAKKLSMVSKYFYMLCHEERFLLILKKYKLSFEIVKLEKEITFFWKNGFVYEEEQNIFLSPSGKELLGEGSIMISPNYLAVFKSDKITLFTLGSGGIKRDKEIIIPISYDFIRIPNISLFEISKGILIKCMDEILYPSFERIENWYRIHHLTYKTYNGVYEYSMSISGNMKYRFLSWEDISMNKNSNKLFVLPDAATTIVTDNPIDLFFGCLHEGELAVVKAINTYKKEEAWVIYDHAAYGYQNKPWTIGNVMIWGKKVFDIMTGKLLFQAEFIINGCTYSGNSYSLYPK